MKQWVGIVVMALAAGVAAAQDCGTFPTTGAPLNLALPPQHCQNWWVPLNSNFTLLNNFAVNTIITNPIGSQQIAQQAGTYLNVNALLLTASLNFGASNNTSSGELTLISPGVFTLDSNAPSDANASLALNALNVKAGIQVNGTAPANHILLGNGSYYVDSATIPSSALPTIYYQNMWLRGTPFPQRSTLNFTSGYFLMADIGGNRTELSLNVAGSGVDPFLAAAAGSGTTGHCVMWDANGGIADSSTICNGTSNTDYYFTFTTCMIAQTGNGYSCFGTYSGSPFPLANSNYSIQCTPMVPLIAGGFTINEASLNASNLPYTWNQIMGNGTSGSAVGATMSCHIHMN